MTVDGRCYLRPTSAPRISAKGSGFWPTPTTQDNAQIAGQYKNPKSGTTLAGAVRMWQTPVADDAMDRVRGKWNSRGEPKLSAQVLIPTPTCDSATERTKRYAQGGMPLTAFVQMMPTPKASDGAKGGPNSIHGTGSLSLPAFAARYPTPCATAAKGWSPGHNRADSDDRLDYTIEREARQSGAHGRLNPEFVEWLMGWPIGHTGLEPVATARLREWRQQHSPCSRPSSIEAAA